MNVILRSDLILCQVYNTTWVVSSLKYFVSCPCVHTEHAERTEYDKEFIEAMDGFVLLLDEDGTVIYVSNNINKHLGIPAVSKFV